MNRTTSADINRAFEAYVRACQDRGLVRPGSHLILESGSPTYGRPWRVYLTGLPVKDETGRYTYPNGSGYHNPPVGDSYLGTSKREACAVLWARVAGMEGGAQ